MSESLESVAAGEGVPPHGSSLRLAFRHSCALHGERTAVLVPAQDGTQAQSLTYTELLAAAERVASSIAALELPAHSLVAICLPRTADLVISMLAVTLAGHAYLPLDPEYPLARLQATLADSQPSAILLGPWMAKRLRETRLPRIIVDGMKVLSAADDTPAADASQQLEDHPDALAYVIYTSGSTGSPKGVMVSHGNVLRLFRATEPWFRFCADDVWTMFHSFSFDFSVWEMWGPLLTGGRLVIVPFALSRDPDGFRALLSREGVTVLNQTPSAFRLLEETDRLDGSPLALRLIIFGGEALVPRSLLPWIERHGDRPRLINMYGITETTVHVTYRQITREDAAREHESLIGVPLPDLTLHLLDGQLQPVPDGIAGELFVGGGGVALGYLHRPDLTASRFLPNPFAPATGDRLYRTGDLARRRPDGELVFLGRADRQVKINGFRIELGEVEAVLARAPAVGQLAVALHPDQSAGARLLCCFTLREGAEATSVTRFAAEHLPAHMRPSFYLEVERLPLTLNGKLDTDALAFRLATDPPSASTLPDANGRRESGLLETVLRAWQQVLGRADAGIDVNFFEAGGTSMQVIALRTRLQAELDRSLPIAWFFQHSTVEALARRLAQPEQPATARERTEPASSPASKRAAWLLTQAQRRQVERSRPR